MYINGCKEITITITILDKIGWLCDAADVRTQFLHIVGGILDRLESLLCHNGLCGQFLFACQWRYRRTQSLLV